MLREAALKGEDANSEAQHGDELMILEYDLREKIDKIDVSRDQQAAITEKLSYPSEGMAEGDSS